MLFECLFFAVVVLPPFYFCIKKIAVENGRPGITDCLYLARKAYANANRKIGYALASVLIYLYPTTIIAKTVEVAERKVQLARFGVINVPSWIKEDSLIFITTIANELEYLYGEHKGRLNTELRVRATAAPLIIDLLSSVGDEMTPLIMSLINISARIAGHSGNKTLHVIRKLQRDSSGGSMDLLRIIGVRGVMGAISKERRCEIVKKIAKVFAAQLYCALCYYRKNVKSRAGKQPVPTESPSSGGTDVCDAESSESPSSDIGIAAPAVRAKTPKARENIQSLTAYESIPRDFYGNEGNMDRRGVGYDGLDAERGAAMAFVPAKEHHSSLHLVEDIPNVARHAAGKNKGRLRTEYDEDKERQLRQERRLFDSLIDAQMDEYGSGWDYEVSQLNRYYYRDRHSSKSDIKLCKAAQTFVDKLSEMKCAPENRDKRIRSLIGRCFTGRLTDDLSTKLVSWSKGVLQENKTEKHAVLMRTDEISNPANWRDVAQKRSFIEFGHRKQDGSVVYVGRGVVVKQKDLGGDVKKAILTVKHVYEAALSGGKICLRVPKGIRCQNKHMDGEWFDAGEADVNFCDSQCGCTDCVAARKKGDAGEIVDDLINIFHPCITNMSAFDLADKADAGRASNFVVAWPASVENKEVPLAVMTPPNEEMAATGCPASKRLLISTDMDHGSSGTPIIVYKNNSASVCGIVNGVYRDKVTKASFTWVRSTVSLN